MRPVRIWIFIVCTDFFPFFFFFSLLLSLPLVFCIRIEFFAVSIQNVCISRFFFLLFISHFLFYSTANRKISSTVLHLPILIVQIYQLKTALTLYCLMVNSTVNSFTIFFFCSIVQRRMMKNKKGFSMLLLPIVFCHSFDRPTSSHDVEFFFERQRKVMQVCIHLDSSDG